MDQPLLRKRATIDDIVRMSGVSRSSVFRYLSGKSLRPALTAAIETAMRRLGYQTASDNGLSACEFFISTSPAFGSFRGYAEVVEGIIARAVEKGVHVSLGHGSGLDAANGGAQTGEKRGVIILGKSMQEEEAEAKELEAKGIPFLLVNRVMTDPGLSFVSADFRAAAKDATWHLLEKGRKRVAIWDDGSTVSRVQKNKLEGFRDAFESSGLAPSSDLMTSRESGDLEAEASRILSSRNPPDAWFAMDDRVAMRVIRTAHDLGLRVPEDLAVIGMNDIETASISRPSISSVHIPFFEAGWTSVDVLCRLIERPVEKTIHIMLGHMLVVRESSDGKEQERQL